MTEIKKKCWPEYFEQIISGKKKFEIRLADFDIKEGDVLMLEEFDPLNKKYTGRTIKKKIKFITKFNPTKFNSIEDIQKFGFYGLEIE